MNKKKFIILTPFLFITTIYRLPLYKTYFSRILMNLNDEIALHIQMDNSKKISDHCL